MEVETTRLVIVGGSSLISWWRRNGNWVVRVVLIPWALTRLCLVLSGCLAAYLPINRHYPAGDAVTRGWHFSPHRWLDMWGRWDSGWYYDIVVNGYRLTGESSVSQVNVVYFPLYPLSVRLLTFWLPEPLRTPEDILAVGIAVSNVCLIAALVLLYRLTFDWTGDNKAARWAILFLLVFPTSYFLSSFYSESIYLLVSVGAFFAAQRQRWGLAGVLSALAAVGRPVGIAVAAALALVYLSNNRWRLRGLGWRWLWLLAAPLTLLAYLGWLSTITGDLLAPLTGQAAWGRQLTAPWTTVLEPRYPQGVHKLLEQAVTVFMLSLAVVSIFLLRSAAYGVYCLLLMLPFLVTGTLQSAARLEMIAFPVFVTLSMLTSRLQWLRITIGVISFILLCLRMALWSRFYSML